MVTKAGIICTHSVKVRLGVLWEIEVDNDVHSLDVDTPGEQVCKQNTKALQMYGTTAQSCPQARSKKLSRIRTAWYSTADATTERQGPPLNQVPTATKVITASYACQAESQKQGSKGDLTAYLRTPSSGMLHSESHGTPDCDGTAASWHGCRSTSSRAR
jgi:hypothetical protein